MANLIEIRDHIVSMLNASLSKTLTYHDTNHTLDVALQCVDIAREEGVTDRQILLELEIAALYHDTGFIFIYNNHEEKSCDIAREQLPGFGIDISAIDNICGMIMATRVPQTPRNELQKIICDADLDYLGRDDFFETGNKLRLELIEYKFIMCEHDWETRQLEFLQTHRYFTKRSRQKRDPVKSAFIKHLIKHKNKRTT